MPESQGRASGQGVVVGGSWRERLNPHLAKKVVCLSASRPSAQIPVDGNAVTPSEFDECARVADRRPADDLPRPSLPSAAS